MHFVRTSLNLRTIPGFFLQPASILRQYQWQELQPDLIAGITVGVVLLPQAIAFSLVAGLPPEMGLHAAVVAAIVGALWGSSNHLHTGPTNSASILILSVLIPIAEPGTPLFIQAAGLLALIIGLFRLVMGLLRLGLLVTFVSDSVIVGFTAGAGVLIIVNALRDLLRISYPRSPGLPETLYNIALNVPETHLLSLALGVGTLLVIVLVSWIDRRLPGPLVAMVGASVAVWAFNLDTFGVQVLGELPRGFPPIALMELPLFDLDLIGELSTGALALATIGLVEATSIARSIGAQSGQRLDSNQEFVGQGLACLASGIFSGYPTSGSFNRSALNFKSGARTSIASVISGVIVLAVVLILAPLAAYIPRAALSGTLILVAYRMVDWVEMRRIWSGTRGDALIMVVTLVATLLLPLQFAILVGILMSLAFYIQQTSVPKVETVLPDPSFRHFLHRPQQPACPQLGIVDIKGDLYFGATSHVEDALYQNMQEHPGQRFLLLRMHNVLHCDISGIHALESTVRTYRDCGGDVFVSRLHEPVLEFMKSTGFYTYLGEDNFLSREDAVSYLFYKVIDPAICIYECPVRAFRECQNLPKRTFDGDISLPIDIPINGVRNIAPETLWQQLREASPPLVIDVREPREFRQGHIPQAQLLPLPRFLSEMTELPTDRDLVLVCRGGRRSTRAAALIQSRGYTNVRVVQGGMVAWESAGLLAAVEANEGKP
jgi:sulfate permease, SulP family